MIINLRIWKVVYFFYSVYLKLINVVSYCSNLIGVKLNLCKFENFIALIIIIFYIIGNNKPKAGPGQKPPITSGFDFMLS